MKQYLLKNGQTITVKEANEDDAEAIKNIVNSVASEKYYVVPERSREDWDEAIREIKKQKGLEKISLTVFSTNEAAINLYRKFGFQIEGISKRQYKIEGKYVDETIMEKFLI